MSKFKDGFVTGVKKEEAYKQEQDRLKKKHDIEEPGVVIVEKNNMGKFTIRLCIRLTKLLASIALLILAAIGILALVYPNVRQELFVVCLQILEQVHRMTGF